MVIGIIGTGYVGLVTGACFAEKGNKVICVDVDEDKINNLKNGIIPIYEPGLEEMVKRNTENGRLSFTTKLSECIDSLDIVFSAVGTPSDTNGSADLRYVLAVARQVGSLVNKKLVFVTKSTVPVGTAKKVKNAIIGELQSRGIDSAYAETMVSVASNPEFLKEGSAVQDFMHPDRIVIGVDDEYCRNLLVELYKPFSIDASFKIIITDIPSAEMIKYASNSMLATRISFMNEIANLCEKVGANVDNVRRGMGADVRIGGKFLYAGCGYGGSCFPKDVKALIKTGEEHGCNMKLLNAVEGVNEKQKEVLFNKFFKYFVSVDGYSDITAAVWGLSFKPNTDDVREAPSIVLIKNLLKLGINVKVTDPIAMSVMKKLFDETQITYCKDKYEAAENADVIFVVTEWGDFMNTDWDKIRQGSTKLRAVIDGRNMFDRNTVEKIGVKYDCIGK